MKYIKPQVRLLLRRRDRSPGLAAEVVRDRVPCVDFTQELTAEQDLSVGGVECSEASLNFGAEVTHETLDGPSGGI